MLDQKLQSAEARALAKRALIRARLRMVDHDAFLALDAETKRAGQIHLISERLPLRGGGFLDFWTGSRSQCSSQSDGESVQAIELKASIRGAPELMQRVRDEGGAQALAEKMALLAGFEESRARGHEGWFLAKVNDNVRLGIGGAMMRPVAEMMANALRLEQADAAALEAREIDRTLHNPTRPPNRRAARL